MVRASLIVAVAAVMVAATAAHRAHASGDEVEVCLVNQSNTHAVLDQTRVFQFGSTRSEFHSRTVYYAGRFVTVDADALEALVAQGLASFGSPLTETVAANLGSLTETFQDSLITFPGGFRSTDYENTDLVVRNADCYWSAAE